MISYPRIKSMQIAQFCGTRARPMARHGPMGQSRRRDGKCHSRDDPRRRSWEWAVLELACGQPACQGTPRRLDARPPAAWPRAPESPQLRRFKGQLAQLSVFRLGFEMERHEFYLTIFNQFLSDDLIPTAYRTKSHSHATLHDRNETSR